MAQRQKHRESAAQIAGRVLLAWRSGTGVEFERQIEYCRGLQSQVCPVDTSESERMDALEGALECLQNLPHARVNAAIRLLEHLAQPRRDLAA